MFEKAVEIANVKTKYLSLLNYFMTIFYRYIRDNRVY